MTQDILNDPKKKEKLTKAVKEAADLKTIQKSYGDKIKDISKMLKEELELQPKIFNKLVKLQMEASMDEERADFEELEALYAAMEKQ